MPERAGKSSSESAWSDIVPGDGCASNDVETVNTSHERIHPWRQSQWVMFLSNIDRQGHGPMVEHTMSSLRGRGIGKDPEISSGVVQGLSAMFLD